MESTLPVILIHVTDSDRAAAFADALSPLNADIRTVSGDVDPAGAIDEALPSILIFENATFETIARLLDNPASPRFPRPPVLLMAGAEAADFDDSTAAPVPDGFIPGPFSPPHVREFVRAMLPLCDLSAKLDRAVERTRLLQKRTDDLTSEADQARTALEQKNGLVESSLNQIAFMSREREQLNSDIAALEETIRTNTDNLISVLSAFIEQKQQIQRGHAHTVTEIAGYAARELGLDDKAVRDVEIASMLHGIGKITIPEDLLLKSPSAYSETEQAFLEQYPVSGAAIIEQFNGLEEAAAIIRHLHEQVAGTGFPDGLAGEEIPIGSRIIAVANIFDNLVFRKGACSLAEAFAIIEEGVGSKYDQQVVSLVQKYAVEHPECETGRVKSRTLFELLPGMTLAYGIYAKSGAKLLPAGTLLTEAAIERIARYAKREPVEETVYIHE